MSTRLNPVRIACLAVFAALTSLAALAQTAPPTTPPKPTEADMRDMAGFLARVNKAVVDKNLKAYCDAALSTRSYKDYIKGYCEASARSEKRDPATCNAAKVAEIMKTEHTKCLATSPAEFAEVSSRMGGATEEFMKEAKSIGLEGKKLLDEAAAKLK